MSRIVQLLDAVIGLETQVRVMALAEECQKHPNPKVRAKQQDLYRHMRGFMKATADLADELKVSAQ
jgi:hypothetical protein